MNSSYASLPKIVSFEIGANAEFVKAWFFLLCSQPSQARKASFKIDFPALFFSVLY